jgi:hypothetical protein
MFFSFYTFIVIISIIVFCVFIYTLYNSIMTIVHNTSNKFARSAQWAGLYFYQSSLPGKGGFNFFKILKLALIGVVSTEVADPTTVINLTDEELQALLEPILSEIGGNVISATYLHSLGLLTPSVIAFLEGLGYIIQ